MRIRSWFTYSHGRTLSAGADILGFEGDGSRIVPFDVRGSGTFNGQPPGPPNHPAFVRQLMVGSAVKGDPVGQIFTQPLLDAGTIADGSYGG